MICSMSDGGNSLIRSVALVSAVAEMPVGSRRSVDRRVTRRKRPVDGRSVDDGFC
jgi:hypothetical protein